MSTEVFALVFGFVLLPAFCVGLERLWPQLKDYRTIRSGLVSDVVWYFFQTFVSRFVAPWIVFFAVWPVFLIWKLPLGNYWAGFGPLSQFPFLAQVVLVFVVGDFLSYWQHRLFHMKFGWPIHAVHHSSENLDWLSSTRFHPLNEIGAQLIYVTPLIAVGLSPMAFVVLAPFTATYAVLLHANVNWQFGPLRHVIASPTFHRWHHTQSGEAQNKNFAGFLPIWDLLFGTFYHPCDKVPEVFGVKEAVPAGFWGQLLYPLRRDQAAGNQVSVAGTNPERQIDVQKTG